MSRLVFIFFMVLTFNFMNMFSQTIYFDYDNAGNRTVRDTIEIGGGESLKSATINKVFKDGTFQGQPIKIYPNPTKGLVEVEIPEDIEPLGNKNRIQLIVTDIRGRIIINNRQESNRITLDLSSQPNGLYVLNIKRGSLISQWKIIKY